MLVTNAQLAQAVPAINALLSATGIRGRGAHRLARIAAALPAPLAAFNEGRSTLAAQYVAKDDKGELKEENGVYLFASDATRQAFEKEMAELLETENELTCEPLRDADLEEARPKNEEEMPMWRVFTLLGPFVTEE